MEKQCIVALELGCLASNTIKEVCGVFLKNWKKYEKIKLITSLLLNSRFKNPRLMFSFIDLEKGKAIVEEYDNKKFASYIVKMSSSFAPLLNCWPKH